VVGLFGGGGGTITPTDAKRLQRLGVQRIFFAGTPLADIAEWVCKNCRTPRRQLAARSKQRAGFQDVLLAAGLTAVEKGRPFPTFDSQPATPVIGFTGPGGAGKTTLIDELALRFFRTRPEGRLAILTHDPSSVGGGALLGDRAGMVYSQDDRVFMRSLATRGRSGGLSAATGGCLEILRHSGFDLVMVESTGTGQQDVPFAGQRVNKQILVLSPDYGARLQLHKIAMFEAADLVVVNKSDLAGARTAAAEIGQRLSLNDRGQKLIGTIAKRHRDPGVDDLYREVMRLEPRAGMSSDGEQDRLLRPSHRRCGCGKWRCGIKR
jgi:putative protein kinase ArgK-like GTPase of G3E family